MGCSASLILFILFFFFFFLVVTFNFVIIIIKKNKRLEPTFLLTLYGSEQGLLHYFSLSNCRHLKILDPMQFITRGVFLRDLPESPFPKLPKQAHACQRLSVWKPLKFKPCVL